MSFEYFVVLSGKLWISIWKSTVSAVSVLTWWKGKVYSIQNPFYFLSESGCLNHFLSWSGCINHFSSGSGCINYFLSTSYYQAHCWKRTIRFQVTTPKLFLWNTLTCSLLSYILNFQKMSPRDLWANQFLRNCRNQVHSQVLN